MTPQTEESFHAGQLRVSVYPSSRRMAAAAAAVVAAEVRRLIADHGRTVGLFASDSSQEAQRELLDCLVETPGIEWTRVIGFQLEEYVGLDEYAPQSSRRFLLDRLVKRVPIAEFHGIRGEAANPAAVCDNYAALLRTRPPDFAILGIGEDGRLGFGGPPPFDFDNSNPLSVVELGDDCRQRLIRDGMFASLKDAPRRAISFTMPAILACPRLFVIASGAKTSRAVRDCLHGEIATSSPASLLRNHAGADLFLDHEAAKIILNEPAS